MGTTIKKKSSKPLDIAKEGTPSYLRLQQENASNFMTAEDAGLPTLGEYTPLPAFAYTFEGGEQSPLMQMETHMGNRDYLGRSMWDTQEVSPDQLERLSDIRAENQPWYAKIAAGAGKMGVLAATTALETAGILYGIGDAAINGEFHRVWDNPITNGLKAVNDLSEDLMPNYYTQDEMENPLSHLFNANWIGDKFLKNIGFMVGAYYGMGVPIASGIGKAGKAMAKAAKATEMARMQGMEMKVADMAARYGDDVVGFNKALERVHLTPMERAAAWKKGTDRIRSIAQNTRTASQWGGSIGSAINEGAIEAINNSRDWRNAEVEKENLRYETELAKELEGIQMHYGDTPEGAARAERTKAILDAEHAKVLEEIEEGRVRMGNADFLLNLPILTASNFVELGKLYARGFKSTQRQMGSFLNNYSIPGMLAQHNLKSDRTWKKAIGKALLVNSAEGAEEYFQKAASDGAGNAVSEAINRYINAGTTDEAKNSLGEYVGGFAKASLKNLGNEGAWDEALVGFLSAMVGMPTFGRRNNSNAVLGKDKPVGLSGGFFGAYNDYMGKKKQEDDLANYLNERVQDPGFKSMYKKLLIDHDYDALLNEAYKDGDKEEAKTLLGEVMFRDLDAIESAGKMAEFKEMIGYMDDFTDEELQDALKLSSTMVSAEELKKRDQRRSEEIGVRLGRREDVEKAIEKAEKESNDVFEEYSQLEEGTPEQEAKYNRYVELQEELGRLHGERDRLAEYDTPSEELTDEEKKKLKEEKDKIDEKLAKSEEDDTVYQDTLEGPFIDTNGPMMLSEEGRKKAKEVIERNRKNYLDAIENFLKVRNDIDVETDGRLSSEDISRLAFMRYQILDMDSRAQEMVTELFSNLDGMDVFVKNSQEEQKAILKKAQENYDEAVKARDAAKKEGKPATKEEEEVLRTKGVLDIQKRTAAKLENIVPLIERLLSKQEMTRSERKAINEGYGKDEESLSYKEIYGNTRPLNAEEVKALFNNPFNVYFLSEAIKKFDIPTDEKQRYLDLISDLSIIGQKQIAYNKELRKAIKDPSYLNELSSQHQKKLSDEEKNNKINELALGLRGAKSLTELHTVYRGAAAVLDPEVVKAAMDKAIEEGNEDFKKAANDYLGAEKFLQSFQKLLNEIENPDIVSELENTVNAVTDFALNNSKAGSLRDTIKEQLNGMMDKWRKNPTQGSQKVADEIGRILKELEDAEVSTNTNSNVSKDTNETIDEKKKARIVNPYKDLDDDELLNAISLIDNKDDFRKAGREVRGRHNPKLDAALEEKKKELFTAAPAVREKEDIKKDIEKEVSDALREGKHVDVIDKLSDKLREDIGEYNKVNDSKQITNSDVAAVLIRLTGNQDLGQEDVDAEYKPNDEVIESEKAAIMRAEVRTTFKSSRPGILPNKTYTDEKNAILMESKEPHEPASEEDKAVQQFLDEMHAQEFLDSGMLGTIARPKMNSSEAPIYFIRHTSNDGVKDVIFLAIKIDNEDKRQLGRVYGETSGRVNFITAVDEKGESSEYQIVGCLHVNDDALMEVKTAHNSLVSKLNEDFDKAHGENPSSPFVTSTIASAIYEINTGRLHKKDKQEDLAAATNSLYDIVQEAPTEKKDFNFGVWVNGEMKTEQGAENRVDPNPANVKSGAIYIYLPRPDGRYYAIRCVRKTMADWYKNSGGEKMVEAVLDKEEDTNKYVSELVEQLQTMLNSKKSTAERITAKEVFSQLVCFTGIPVRISFAENENKITFLVGEKDNERNVSFDDGLGTKKAIQSIFEFLTNDNMKDHVRMSVPDLARVYNIHSSDVIAADILNVRMAGFNNFNADFSVMVINGKGDVFNSLEAAEKLKEEGALGNGRGANIRQKQYTFTYNGKTSSYTYSFDDKGNVNEISVGEKVLDPSDDEYNIAASVWYAITNPEGSTNIVYLLNDSRKLDLSSETKQKLAGTTEFSDLFYFWLGSEAKGIRMVNDTNVELVTIDDSFIDQQVDKVNELIKSFKGDDDLKLKGAGEEGGGKPLKKGKASTPLAENKIFKYDDIKDYKWEDMSPMLEQLFSSNVPKRKRNDVLFQLRALEAYGVDFDSLEFQTQYNDMLASYDTKKGRDTWDNYVNKKVCP